QRVRGERAAHDGPGELVEAGEGAAHQVGVDEREPQLARRDHGERAVQAGRLVGHQRGRGDAGPAGQRPHRPRDLLPAGQLLGEHPRGAEHPDRDDGRVAEVGRVVQHHPVRGERAAQAVAERQRVTAAARAEQLEPDDEGVDVRGSEPDNRHRTMVPDPGADTGASVREGSRAPSLASRPATGGMPRRSDRGFQETEMYYIRFPGFRTRRKLLLQLYVPTHRSTPPPHTSPMVVCVQPEGHTRAVGVLSDQFEPARVRRGPHANVTERPDSTGGNALDLRYRDVLELRSLLGAICNELARTEGGGYRFPRFRLLQWLMEVDLPSAPPEDRIVELQKRLQDRSLGRIAHRKDPGSDLPWRLRLLGWVLTPAYFWVRQSGVVPGFGRQYRWFLRRQPNLAPRPHRTFFSLAERLAPPEWKREDPEQVRRLLVNAFLADLRREHRRIGWFRHYRTTVPIVLLDRDAVPGADTLIRTIGAVRNETGIDDPLLLVTSGSALPAFVAHPDGGDVSALPQPTACGEDATEVLERWRAQLPHERRRRNEAAWVVVCDLTNDRDLRQLPPREPAKRGRQSFEPGHPPLWRRRWVAAVLAGVVVAVPTAVGVFDDWRTCGTGLTWLLEERLPSELERIDDVCIGVLDPGDPRLPYPEVLGGVGATI